jgi:hypothetical protein
VLVWCQKTLVVILILAVGLAGNLHLPIIQAIAWTRMYAHYREGYSVQQALEVTFSGKAPCEMCKFVQAATKERNTLNGTYTNTFRLLLPIAAAEEMHFSPNLRSWIFWETTEHLPAWAERPELPPPRWA